MADALKEIKGLSARADELWMACASKVFPVPVSPSKTTGISDLAANSARRRHLAIASLLVVRSSTFRFESGFCMWTGADLLPHTLAQLVDRLQRVLNRRTISHNNVRIAAHPHAQRQTFPSPPRDISSVERCQCDKVRTVGCVHSRMADPIQFSPDNSVALIGIRFKKISDALSDR